MTSGAQPLICVVPIREIDRSNVSELDRLLATAVRRLRRQRRTRLVVDLSAVKFIDSRGVRALIDADLAAMELGARLEIAPDISPEVRRILTVSGLWERWCWKESA